MTDPPQLDGSPGKRSPEPDRRIAPVFLAVAVLLAAWLVWYPPSPDLAAQVYRADLFSTAGFSIWDNAWYAGHYLPGYSLIFPPLGSLLGVRSTGVLAVALSTLIFARLASLPSGFRTRPATMLFALGATGDLFIGRVTFALGVAFGLASVLAGVRGHRVPCLVCSLACAAASPVAAAFLVLVACADLTANRAVARAAVLAGPALGLVLGLVLAFPDGGYEPFALTSLVAAAGAAIAVIVLLPSTDRLIRQIAGLYLVGLVLAYLVRSPVGGNAVRFGILFAPAALAGRVRVADVQRVLRRVRAPGDRHPCDGARRPIGRTPATILLGLLGVAALVWQISGPIGQSVGGAVDPSARHAFYAPAIGYLDGRSAGRAMRIEVAFTRSHWDATILARRFLLARGWERQLDTRYDALFYAPTLTPASYEAWLRDNAVRFVALSTAPADFSSVQEYALIGSAPPFLRLVFQSPHWRIYEVRAAVPLATGPGALTAVGASGFTLYASRPGRFLVRLHYTPYWTVIAGRARITRAPGGWTEVLAERAGPIAVAAELPGDIHL